VFINLFLNKKKSLYIITEWNYRWKIIRTPN